MSERATSRELTTEEQEALQRFKQNDEKIDDMLVLVIQDIELLKEKATKIDEVEAHFASMCRR
ncbi:MAG: hypothetical protein P4M11_01825 [Candidatus Pacebacteria bacterium]|nr:hypothetical protein [Candidatus Paceibacterota bacterium]